MTSLDDVLITGELSRRPARAPDYEAENRALVGLARAMADDPQSILQRLVEVAMELTLADTAGVSLLEERDGEPPVFRWHAIAGMCARHLMGMSPRDFSPCGIVLDRAAPQLFDRPGRYFVYLGQAEPRIHENLLIPFHINARPVGTLWLIAHDERRQFDAEDVRVMTSLATFCAAALQAVYPLHAGRGLVASRVIGEQPATRRAQAEHAREVETRLVEARREAEERFHTLVQNVHDYAIFMLDPAGRVTAWNEGAARLKGYTEAEILGKHISVFFTPEDRQIGKPEYEIGMAEAHGRYEGEGWRVRKDGSRFWANEIIAAMRGPGGELRGFTKVARDLTDRKAVEDALRASEERYRLLVENIRDHAIITLDPDARVASWNPGAQRIFGYAEHEIVGRHGSILFTPEDNARGEHAKELATALAEGRASDDRWQVRKGGERFWASGVTTPMRDVAGGLRGYAKVCRDLTERKQVEEQRERLLAQEQIARAEAERAMTMRDEFLAIVSHELRTPLTVVLLWTKMLRSGLVKDAERARVFETIEQSADAQRQLIEDLLDISRITSGKLHLSVRETDLAVVVRAAVEAVRPMAEAKGVRVETHLDDRAGLVRADPDRIQQVVWNLVNNAVKFTDRGGRVDVRLARRGGDGGGVRIDVADTGRGISPAFLPSVFELFRQADNAFTRSHGGLGLGLSICRKLIELHGGTITAASPGEGKGATFTVELPSGFAPLDPGQPLTPATGAAAAVASFAASPVLAGLRVLLAEDEPHTRTAVRWLLEQCGADVTAVDSAAAAVAAFRAALSDGGGDGDGNGGYHVLLSDIAMPGEDGYQLLGHIRALERARGQTRPVPAIAITAHAAEADRTRAAAAGFHSHLPKPVEPTAVVSAVAALAGRGQPAGG